MTIDREALRSGWTPVRFLLLLSLRINLRLHLGAVILMTFAVAASAAMVTGLEIASRGVRHELAETAAAVAGRADLEVVSSPRGVSEDLVSEVAAVPGVFAASPLILETFRLPEPMQGVPLRILGVDLLAETEVREYRVTEDRVRVRDPLRLLAVPNAVIIPEVLAERLGIHEHETFTVRGPSAEHALLVKGLLTRGGLADAYGGLIAVMDVWSLQHLLGAEGWVDKIEVTLADGVDADEAARAIEQLLGGTATVRSVSEPPSWVASLIEVLDFAAWGIDVVGVLVAGFVAYAAVAHVVEARLRDISAMRSLGLDARGAATLILVDALAICAVGTAAGLAGGVWLARPMLRGFSLLSELYQSVPIREVTVAPSTFVAAVAVWLSIAALAAILPVRRTLARHPLDALLERKAATARAAGRRSLLGLALGAVAVAALAGVGFGVSSVIASAGVLIGGLGALLVAGGPLLFSIARRLRGLRVAPRLRSLIGLSVLARPAAAGLTLASLAAMVGAQVALLTSVDSLVRELDEWTYRGVAGATFSIRADIGAPVAVAQEGLMAPATIEIVRTTPGVQDLARFFGSEVTYRGEQVQVGALESAALLRHEMLEETNLPTELLAAALQRGEVVVSHAFGRRFDVEVGDEITLPTRRGASRFRIAAVTRDYGGPAGSVEFDLAVFDRHFDRRGATRLLVWASGSEAELLKELHRRTASSQPIVVRDQVFLRKGASHRLERFRHLLLGVVVIFAAFGSISLASTMMSSIAAQRRELALARISGASPAGLVAGLVLDALVVGSVGCALGALLGIAGGFVITGLLYERFGWVVSYRVRQEGVASLLVFGAILVCSAGAAALGVARRPLAIEAPRQG